MPRRLRIEYPGAIYHVMARGNARQDIVQDDDDRTRLRDDLARATGCFEWELVAYVLMSNHFHLLLKTPRPNLGRGMQRLLSAYSLWNGRRRRRPGHLFQGRYRAESIEDEMYYWTVSRYIHLNPVRAGLVARPEDWEWSSFPGYARRSRRADWVAHDSLLAAWSGEFGGREPAPAYRRFVASGIKNPPASPFRDAFDGWILGSSRFVSRLRSALDELSGETRSMVPEARRLRGLRPEEILDAVAAYYGVERSSLARPGDPHLARAVAAWLCRRHTQATLRQLAEPLGLSRPDSVPNLTRRIDAKIKSSPQIAQEVREILNQIQQETKNKV